VAVQSHNKRDAGERVVFNREDTGFDIRAEVKLYCEKCGSKIENGTAANGEIQCYVCHKFIGCMTCAENVRVCLGCGKPLCTDHAMVCLEANGKVSGYVCSGGCE
jgi:hypothetical protein